MTTLPDVIRLLREGRNYANAFEIPGEATQKYIKETDKALNELENISLRHNQKCDEGNYLDVAERILSVADDMRRLALLSPSHLAEELIQEMLFLGCLPDDEQERNNISYYIKQKAYQIHEIVRKKLWRDKIPPPEWFTLVQEALENECEEFEGKAKELLKKYEPFSKIEDDQNDPVHPSIYRSQEVLSEHEVEELSRRFSSFDTLTQRLILTVRYWYDGWGAVATKHRRQPLVDCKECGQVNIPFDQLGKIPEHQTPDGLPCRKRKPAKLKFVNSPDAWDHR